MRILLMLMMTLACGLMTHATTIATTTYAGYAAYRLSDGHSEAIVVPRLSGRVMRYGFVGGPNLLWNAPAAQLGGTDYKNWGGDKTFAGPHPSWNTFASSIWPPDPSWDGAGHEAKILPNGHLQTIGGIWRGFGVRVRREFSFNDNGEFVIAQRIEKVEGEPRLITIWEVAQAVPPEAVFLPLNTATVYKTGFHASGPLPDNAKLQIHDTLLQVTPAPGQGYKIGADSPVSSIAAVTGDVAWLLRADKPGGEYPDGAAGAGFPVEFYNHGDAGAGHYVELELLSPLRRFVAGGGWTHATHWSLHRLLSTDVNAPSTRVEIVRLLAGQT